MAAPWLILIHQLPPKPDYLRVKIWRHMQRTGAVLLKNSVYLLPNRESLTESLQWAAREIIQAGGEAIICEAQFIAGASNRQLEEMFIKARDSEYTELIKQARQLLKRLSSKDSSGRNENDSNRPEYQKLKRRLDEISTIDFFGAPSKETAGGLLKEIESKLNARTPGYTSIGKQAISRKELNGRTWVTRKGIHIDRMASAWLIRRFLDPKAKFKFVSAKDYQPRPKELRFDMFEAEFTHEGDFCTFEVLVQRGNLKDPALKKIAEIVHDIDLKDSKYNHQETIGLDQLVRGIIARFIDDNDRLTTACDMFDNFYEIFQGQQK
jgi:hypothetical protein